MSLLRNPVRTIVRVFLLAHRLGPYSVEGKRQILTLFQAFEIQRAVRADRTAGKLSQERSLNYLFEANFHPVIMDEIFQPVPR